MKFTDKEKITEAIRNSKSLREASRYLNTNHTQIRYLVKKFDIDTSHFTFGKNYKNLIGQTFNKLTITETFKDKDKRWKCHCNCGCGQKTTKRIDSVVSGKIPSCGCISKNRPSMVGGANPAFAGCGEMRSVHYRNIIVGAKRRSIEFNLTKNYLWELFLQQNKKCALSGQDLFFGRVYYSHETTASLDRIDNNKSYTEDNVQWVHKDINKMKSDFDQEYFKKLCKLVSAKV